MSSFQESMVANKLRKYITAHGEEDVKNHCWKINAGPHGWGLFFDNNPHLKDADRKPKKFCEAQSAALSWLSDLGKDTLQFWRQPPQRNPVVVPLSANNQLLSCQLVLVLYFMTH